MGFIASPKRVGEKSPLLPGLKQQLYIIQPIA
jgi:hypothetical protein